MTLPPHHRHHRPAAQRQPLVGRPAALALHGFTSDRLLDIGINDDKIGVQPNGNLALGQPKTLRRISDNRLRSAERAKFYQR
jgi:hypothetical protein